MKLKIHTDIEKLSLAPTNGYIFPLIEYLNNEKSILHNYYELSTLEESHFAVLPLSIDFLFNINEQKYVDDFISKAKKINKKVIVFTGGDTGKTIDSKNIITIRLGGYNDKFDENTHVMSPFINDPYEFLKKEITYLDKKECPEIGFVGHSDGSFIKIVKEFSLFLMSNFKRIIGKDVTDIEFFYPSSYYRYKYLNLISNSEKVKTNFIYRNKYRAGVTNKDDLQKTTLEFFLNVFNNPYTFCMRGGGNFSVRFYETLAMGRIPVLINTNNRLPFYKEIDWDRHCIIIDNTEIKTANYKINEFHLKLSPEDFITLQKSNRKLWEDYFTKDNFFIQFSKQLQKQIY